jgi:HlyD family secretion protein
LRKRQSDFDEAVKEAERAGKTAAAEESTKVRTLEGAEKELSLVREKLAQLRGQREKCRILAPTQGIVVYFGGGGRHFMTQEPIKEGGEVHERQVLMQLPDTSAMVAVVRVHEAKTDKLQLGQSVTLRFEGITGKQFTGKVTKIAALADTQNRWLNPDLKEYETEISLDPTDEPLKPGVTAHVDILVESVENRLAIPVQSVFTKGGRRYAVRTDGIKATPIPVRIGAVGTEWVEVAEGLSANDIVLLSLSDEQKRLIPDAPAQGSGPVKQAGRNSDQREREGQGRPKAEQPAAQGKATDATTSGEQPKREPKSGGATTDGQQSGSTGTR